MIVDFVLGVVFTVIDWVVGLLPSFSIGTLGEHYYDAGHSHWVRDVLSIANYFLPVRELFSAMVTFLAIYSAIILYRFIWRLIPGLG